jgi:hypothetical protein
MSNVIWTPQPRQADFLSRPEYECLYGGAAGGGKSDALLMEALRQVDNCDYIALILRKTYPQLSELIDRSTKLYKMAYPKARYNASAHRWTFPSGAQIYFGSMQHTKDRINYQGKRYDFIAFDELTHFTWEEYSYMFSRNRPSQSPKGTKNTRVYMRATTNPGGIGHGWVKERFITVAPPMTKVIEEFDITLPDGTVEKKSRDRIFVPATIFDNQKLLNNDPNYLASLAMLPSADRDALLYGSWDSFDGQVFREWKNNPSHYQDHMWTHVVEPFEVPAHWKIMRCFDWGYTRPYACYWMAVSPEKHKYIIRELYGCNGQPNRGTEEHHVEVARQIREIEDTDPNLKGRKIFGVADPAIFEESRGTSIANDMAKAPNYIVFQKGDHSRVPGKMQVHYHLAFNEEGYPLMQVFETCKHLIRTLPNLTYDEKDVEDINSDLEDHAYDAIRYGLMESPVAPRKHHKAEEIIEDDPLNMNQKVVRLRRF